jgi:hypothetical protein
MHFPNAFFGWSHPPQIASVKALCAPKVAEHLKEMLEERSAANRETLVVQLWTRICPFYQSRGDPKRADWQPSFPVGEAKRDQDPGIDSITQRCHISQHWPG